MPSVESNTVHECDGCHNKFDFEEMPPAPFRCPNCGSGSFTQLVIVLSCDFCSATMEGQTVWSHPCADFQYAFIVAGQPPGGSRGDWCACSRCHELIEASDLTALVDRAVEHDLQRHPEARAHLAEIRRMTEVIHKGFFEHRTGPGYIEPSPDKRRGG